MHLIYSTFPSKVEAHKVAEKLVKEKLIACANIFESMTSLYEWEGEVKQETECSVFFKVATKGLQQAMDAIKTAHSYECACIIAIKIEKGEADYLKWVENSFKVDY